MSDAAEEPLGSSQVSEPGTVARRSPNPGGRIEPETSRTRTRETSRTRVARLAGRIEPGLRRRKTSRTRVARLAGRIEPGLRGPEHPARLVDRLFPHELPAGISPGLLRPLPRQDNYLLRWNNGPSWSSRPPARNAPIPAHSAVSRGTEPSLWRFTVVGGSARRGGRASTRCREEKRLRGHRRSTERGPRRSQR